MASLPSERKALLFSTGGVRLALRLAHIREIVDVPPGATEVATRGEVVPSVSVAAALGLPAGPAPYALLQDRAALRAEALHGIVDLAEAEVFQLPARTGQPRPAPFVGAVVWKGTIALEIATPLAGPVPPRAAEDVPPPAAGSGPPAEREFLFARGGWTYGVPHSLLVQVLEAPRVTPVPLAPPSHRGLVYHGRAIHPVLDVAVRYGHARSPDARYVLLLDAGGSGIGVVADRVLRAAEATGEVVRPPWDALW